MLPTNALILRLVLVAVAYAVVVILMQSKSHSYLRKYDTVLVDSVLSPSEFTRAVQGLSIAPDEEPLFAVVDLNGNSEISIDEFYDLFANHYWLNNIRLSILGMILWDSVQVFLYFTGFSKLSTLLVAYLNLLLIVEFQLGWAFLDSGKDRCRFNSVHEQFFSRECAEKIAYTALPSFFFIGTILKRFYSLINPATFYTFVLSAVSYLVLFFVSHIPGYDLELLKSTVAGTAVLTILLLIISITSPLLSLYWVPISCIVVAIFIEFIEAVSSNVDFKVHLFSHEALVKVLTFASTSISFWLSEIASDHNQAVRNSLARKRISTAAERGVVFHWLD